MEATLWPRGVRGVLSDRRRPTPWRVHRPTGRSSPGDHRAGACSVKHPQRGDDSWRDRYAALARGSASTSSTSCCSRWRPRVHRGHRWRLATEGQRFEPVYVAQ